MFVDCPYCGFLVALDDDGRQPARCPNCAQRLREDIPPVAVARRDGAGANGPGAPHDDAPAVAASTGAGGPGGVAASIAPPRPGVAPAPVEPVAHAGETASPASQPATPRTGTDAGLAPIPPGTGRPATPHEPAPGDAPHVRADGGPDAATTAAPPTASAQVAVPAPSPPEPAATPVEAAAAQASTTLPAPRRESGSGSESGSEPGGDRMARHAAAPAQLAPPEGAPPSSTQATAAAPADAPVESADDGRPGPSPAIPALAPAAPPGATASPDPAPAAAPEATPATAPAGAPPTESAASADATVATDQDPAAAPPAPLPPRQRTARPAVPSFARTRDATPTGRRRLRWELAGIAALCLLLALQLLLSQRARLAADAQWRPLLSSLCGALRCTLPPWREPDAFRVLERDVRAHAPGVLRVSARIRNDARWAQPWPALQLTLSDADGRAVATRLFQPREYLGGAPTQPRIDSGQSAALRMDIVEPGPQAVAFTFDFE